MGSSGQKTKGLLTPICQAYKNQLCRGSVPDAPESGEVKTGNYGFPDIFGNAYFPDMFGNYGFPNRKRLWKLGPRP